MRRECLPRDDLVQILTALSGKNFNVIASIHHGICETPSLQEWYPYADLRELCSMAGASWSARMWYKNRNPSPPWALIGKHPPWQPLGQEYPTLDAFLENESVARIISELCMLGFEVLDRHEHAMPGQFQDLYARSNPNNGEVLLARAKQFLSDKPAAAEQLRTELRMPVNGYVSNREYAGRRDRGDVPESVVRLPFLPYRKARRMNRAEWRAHYAAVVEGYARNIADQLRIFPATYVALHPVQAPLLALPPPPHDPADYASAERRR